MFLQLDVADLGSRPTPRVRLRALRPDRPSLAYSLFTFQLASKGALPLRAVEFLEDAHRLGLLPAEGPLFGVCPGPGMTNTTKRPRNAKGGERKHRSADHNGPPIWRNVRIGCHPWRSHPRPISGRRGRGS